MNTIRVNTSSSYDVLVGSHILSGLGSLARKVTNAEAVAIVSDSNVWPLYGHGVTSSLQQAGFHVVEPYLLPPGEGSKNGRQFLSILEHLASSGLTRGDCLVALGGGVVGDIAGFSAACYLRGIDYIQVPTTLLSCVDSSVGGKTAIDLSAGKNLAGTFYQPRLVVCDTAVLTTLPDKEFREGCAEVIKYGILYDETLFAHLQERAAGFDREYVISRCIALKRDAVQADEYDRGARKLLNFGHTVGHALEAISGYSLSHGAAVAIGMAVMARCAFAAGHCESHTKNSILDILQKFGLPIHTEASAQSLYQIALLDKKRCADTVSLVVPKEIGVCTLLPTHINDLKSFIEAGL